MSVLELTTDEWNSERNADEMFAKYIVADVVVLDGRILKNRSGDGLGHFYGVLYVYDEVRL